jgi:hypothetical protein
MELKPHYTFQTYELQDEIIFSDTSCDDLVALCSLFMAHPSVNKTVKFAGKCQLQAFTEDRLKGSVTITSPLAKNELPQVHSNL